jgi:hypothetical protein
MNIGEGDIFVMKRRKGKWELQNAKQKSLGVVIVCNNNNKCLIG